MISFILNNVEINSNAPTGTVLLDFIRERSLSGTKEGCREGDCGACLVLQGKIDGKKIHYQSVNSCLVPLGDVHGSHIVTIEGIDNGQLNPLQEAFVDQGATQCGYCTPGFILAETAYLMNHYKPEKEEAIAAVDGNICRCTGYMSIKRAITSVCETVLPGADAAIPETVKPAENGLNAATTRLINKGFLPVYFSNIYNKLKKLPERESTAIDHPEYLVAGGTDLYVQQEPSISDKNIQLIFNDTSLKQIYKKNEYIYLGAATTVTDFIQSEIINHCLPDLRKQLLLHSSTPIRNRATMAGNIVNASPIADMTIILLALNAILLIKSQDRTRSVSLHDFYYDYKKFDLQKGEQITQVFFKEPPDFAVFNFEKVSRRTYLDIASVNSAALMERRGNKIATVYISAGGVAPFPLLLEKTSALLSNNDYSKDLLEETISTAQKEISPISDMRGSAEYKSKLLGRLLKGHLLKTFGDKIEPGDVI